MRNYIFLLFVSLWAISASGQVLSGTVSAAGKGEKLIGVTVIADDTIGINTDVNGLYSLKLSPGKHSISFKLISFETVNRTITLQPGETLELNIALKEKSHLLNIVVVSAGKFEQNLEEVTVSMEVLKPELIEKRNIVTMEDGVDYIPGVSMIDGQANIRGGSGWSYGAGSRVQILVDDLPQLTADAGDTKWSFLPLENIEQVEVIKGASSVLFGSSALNGVINFRTAYPRDTPTTKINVFGAIYDRAFITTDKEYSLNFRGKTAAYGGMSFLHSRKINRLDVTLSGNYFKDDGYRQGENEKRGRVSLNTRYNFKVKGLSAGINFNTIATTGTLFFLWKNDTSGAYIPAKNSLSDYDTYRTSVDPYITYTGSNGSSHKIRTRWFNTTNKNNTDQNSTGNLYYTEYQYQKHFKEILTITAGTVNTFSSVKSQIYGDHDGNQSAFYTQGDLKFGRLIISAGTRIEQSKVDTIKDKWNQVYRSGINFHPFGATYLRASAGQGYRFPTIAERYIRTNVSGVNIFPNEQLEPEKGISVEIGVKQGFSVGSWKGYFDLAFFRNNYKNMMEFVFAQWAFGPDIFKNLGFRSLNVGKTQIEGFEATFAAEGKLPYEFALTAMAGYTFLNPRQLTYDSAYVRKVGYANFMGSDSSDFLKYRFKHMIKGDLDLSRKNFSIGASIRYTSQMVNIDRIFMGGLLDIAFPPGLGIADYRKYHNKGDIILDVRVSYRLPKNITAALIVKNATNRIYMQRPADMQAPRVFVLQAGIKF